MLVLVPTPIGHLQDITFRAVDTLKKSHLILCEDTRRSRILLDHFSISVPLKSYHKYTEKKQLESILLLLKEGKTISLISDAGTPGIADPGEILVKACIEENISVVPLPGPCALITALIASGFPTTPFQFVGFVPKKSHDWMFKILTYSGTTICYESALRIKKTIELIASLDPEREIVLGRELTKKFEEFLRGKASFFKVSDQIKGEIVLLIKENPLFKQTEEEKKVVTPLEEVEILMTKKGLSLKDAVKEVALIKKLNKRNLYNTAIKLFNSPLLDKIE